ncbi:hypothetical protein [Psychromonas ingrahamii]
MCFLYYSKRLMLAMILYSTSLILPIKE